MKKNLFCLFMVCAFVAPVYSGELIIEHAKPKGINGTNYQTVVADDASTYSKVTQGDTQESVIKKMGRPDIASTDPNGRTIWVYTKTEKNYAADYYRGNSMSGGAASLNMQIARSGLDSNIYNGGDSAFIPHAEIPEELVTTTIKIMFDTNGVVNDIESKTER